MFDNKPDTKGKAKPAAHASEPEPRNLTRDQLEETHYARFRAEGLGESEARGRARIRAREQCG